MSENCINKLVDKLGLTKAEALDVASRTEKLLKEGKSAEEIMNDVIEFKDKRAAYVKSMNQYNLLRDRSITNKLKQRVLNQLINPKEIKRVFGVEIDNPLIRATMGIVREHMHHRNQLYDTYAQEMARTLDSKELSSYASDISNSKKIYQEMAALRADQTRSISATGDDKAFQIAKTHVGISEAMRHRQTAAGSSKWYRNDFIFSQKYDSAKVAKLSDNDFFELMKDVKWSKVDIAAFDAAAGSKGDIKVAEEARKREWIKFKREVESGNYVDPEELLNGGGEFSGGGSLAEVSGRSRSIELTPEQYIEIGDKLFSGDSFLERAFLEYKSGSRLIADLEMFGSKPADNFDKIMGSLIAEKKNVIGTDQEKFFINGKKSVLENAFFQSTANQKSTLIRQMFGEKASNEDLAKWANTLRGLDAASKLGGAALTSLSDLMTRAINDTLISGNKRQVFQTLADSVDTLTKSFGKAEGLGLVEDTIVGLETVFDDIVTQIRMEDLVELSSIDRSATVRDGLDYMSQKIFKLNGLKLLTEAQRRGSMAATMANYGRLSGDSFDNLSPYAREQMSAYGIGSQEWDFIRAKAKTKTPYGKDILSPTALNKLELEEFKTFTETTDPGLLKNIQIDLTQKLKKFENKKVGSLKQLKDTSFEDLPVGIKDIFTSREWNFLRRNSVDVPVSKLDVNIFVELSGTTNLEVLKNTRNEIGAKWSNFIRSQTETATLMPDTIDTARLSFGTRSGTFLGEAARFATMYKSFAFGYMAKVFLPQLKYANAMTHFQYTIAATAMGAAIFTLKDLAKGRTPRDFTKPENMRGLLFHVYGFPYMDQFAFAVNSDNVQASSVYDIFAGPIAGDAVDTFTRTANLAKDDDPNYAKYAARTFIPMLPFRNHPLTTGIYNQGYNYAMRHFDPNYERNHQKMLDQSGQAELFGNGS